MLTWKLHKKEFDLSFQWKISRGATSKKTLYFAEVSDGEQRAFGEISSITQSTQTPIEQAFQLFVENNEPTLSNVNASNLATEIKFGMSSALIHLECLKNNEPLWQRLNLRAPTKVQTSFSIPIMEASEIPSFFQKYNLKRFPFIKVKIAHSDYMESLEAIRKQTDAALRIDANEAFKTPQAVTAFFEQIHSFNIDFIEQPMPRDQDQAMIDIKKSSPFKLIADESIQSNTPGDSLKDSFHGINIKLMKTGSYQQALEQIKWAQKNDLQIMLGCMVESSLGIYGALCMTGEVDYVDLDGFLFFKNEPFNLISEENGTISAKNDLFKLSL